jgi:hypothetical protein
MKKNYVFTLLIGFAFALIANNVTAQGPYACLNLGYGLGKSTMNLEAWSFYNSTTTTSTQTDEQIVVSLGKGLNFGGTIGNMFNENVGAELGINYLLGGKAKAKDEYPDGTTEYKFYARMLRFIPAIVIAAGSDGINPYAKFGVVISTGSAKYEWEDNDNGDLMIAKWKYSGGIALGFMGAVGALYPLNDNMSLFVEINTINQSYAPKKGELKEATVNGVDQLPDLTTSQKEVEFVKETTYDFEGGAPPSSEPTEQLKQKLPLGSVGINFGIELRF